MKRFISLFLGAILIFAVVGCSSVNEWQEQYDLGVRYLNDGDYAEAIIAFTAAIEIDANNTMAYFGRAEAYISSGETEENLSYALLDYEMIISIDDSNPEAYLGLADVYIRQGNYEKALELLDTLPEEIKTDEIKAKIAEMKKGNIADSDGKTRKSSHYENGELIAYWVYEYDEKGNNTITTRYNADNSASDILTSEFDDTGLELKQTLTSLENSSVRIEKYEYDSQRRIIKETIEQTDETGFTSYDYTIFSYDLNNKSVIQDTYSSEGVLQHRFIVENDENGRRYKGSQYYLDDNGDFYLDYYVEYIWNSDGSYGGYNLFRVAEKEDN